MEFGIFYEHQLPRPWDDDAERDLYHEALAQIALADELGFDYAWEVEHHFLEEYSHSSAPEVFLAAAANATEDIRLGHGIKLMPPNYNPPQRVAEQLATLDIVADGRVEWGTGESATRMEMEGFGIDPTETRAMWRETTEAVADMLEMEPYPGHDGEYFAMPPRNVIPKPVQDPHPPLWMACSSRETIETAARNGVGALCFSFTDPDEAGDWVDTYYETFKEECVPIGRAVNPNVAMVTGFSCHADGEEARRRAEEGFAFFRFAIARNVVGDFDPNKPGYTNIWEEFQAAGGTDFFDDDDEGGGAIGSPAEIREHLRGFEAAGVDQVIFLQQGGKNEHEHICDSLELFAETVMPDFHERGADRRREKRAELEPYIEAALERKDWREPLPEAEAPGVAPYSTTSDLAEQATEGADD